MLPALRRVVAREYYSLVRDHFEMCKTERSVLIHRFHGVLLG